MSSTVFSLSGRNSSASCAALRNMQQQGELCDCVLEIDTGEQISVHKCVLAASSAYFKAMFTIGLAESNQRVVRIRETHLDVLSAVVAFCYCADVSLTSSKVLQLLIAADLLQIDLLFCECSKFLETQLHPSSVLGLRAHARLHNSWRLFQMCSEFVFQNFKQVSESEELLDLPADQLLELIADDRLRVSNEEEVYLAVLRWAYHDLEKRRSWFAELMSHVRLAFVSTDFLVNSVEREQLMHDEECQHYIAEARLFKSSPEKRGQLKHSPRTRPRKLSGLQEVILVVGGMSAHDGAVPTLDQYDSRTDTWTTLVELPRPRHALAACFHDGNLYVSGGYSKTLGFINLMECYSMRANTWTEMVPLQSGRRYHCMVVLLGLLYVIGGQNFHKVLNSVERYDPIADRWETMAALTHSRMYHGAVEVEGKLYVAGGHSGTERLCSVETYNVLTDQWCCIAPLSEPRSVMGIARLGPSIYVAGGYNGREHLDTVECYDLELERWLPCPPMSTARSAFGLVAYDGCLYACGGFNRNFLSSVERYSPGSGNWLPTVSMNCERVHYGITVM